MWRSKKTGLSGLVLTFGLLAALVPPATADTVGPITFEPPTYALGSVNRQNGWVVTNPAFDQAVVANTGVPSRTAASCSMTSPSPPTPRWPPRRRSSGAAGCR